MRQRLQAVIPFTCGWCREPAQAKRTSAKYCSAGCASSANNAARPRLPLHRRLWDKFTISDGCWEWTAQINPNGYGSFKVDGRPRRAHRVVYEWLVGPIPAGLELDHLCFNKACVRPDHLEPVTHKENMQRMNARR